MWATAATTVSLTFNANPFPILRNRTDFKALRLIRASTSSSSFDYPLASRVIVTNLPFSTSEKSLLENFSSFGRIADGKNDKAVAGLEMKLVKEKETRKSKGYAFIQFTTQDDAMLAIENMDHQHFNGRKIFVEIAKPGKASFREYPKTTGPPKLQMRLMEQENVDCWY